MTEFLMEYFRLLEKNRKFFDNAMITARQVERRAKKIFDDCQVFIVGSFAEGRHKLSSDLDILIISQKIPEKFSFEWYCNIVKRLSDDNRVNIHLVNKRKFKEVKRLYWPRIEVVP